ncbi:MAG: Uncharacterised protein [Halieaceae bacterium]|nr:MAG: Uncharacterised protein [Halieaceae bacterium]
MVAGKNQVLSASKIMTLFPGGSSSVFRSAFAAADDIRSAPEKTSTFCDPYAEVLDIKSMASLTCSTPIPVLPSPGETHR